MPGTRGPNARAILTRRGGFSRRVECGKIALIRGPSQYSNLHLRRPLQLLQHAGRVELIPGFDDLLTAPAHHYQAGDGYVVSGWSDPQSVAGVLSGEANPHHR